MDLRCFSVQKRGMNLLWLNGDSRMRDGGGGSKILKNEIGALYRRRYTGGVQEEVYRWYGA
jgi:hypothetical protein